MSIRVMPSAAKLWLTISSDGVLELGPDIQPSEAAEALADAYSVYVRGLKERIARLEAIRSAADRMATLFDSHPFWHDMQQAVAAYRAAMARLDQAGEGTE